MSATPVAASSLRVGSSKMTGPSGRCSADVTCSRGSSSTAGPVGRGT